jgi:hypothetical protein
MDTAAQTTPSAPSSPKSTPIPGDSPSSKTALPATAAPGAAQADLPKPGAPAPAAKPAVPAFDAPKAPAAAAQPAASVSAPGTDNERINAPVAAQEPVTRDGTAKSEFFTTVRSYARNITAAAQKLTDKLDTAGHTAEAELNKLNAAVTEMNDHLNASNRTASTSVAGTPILSNTQKASNTQVSPLSDAGKAGV